MEYKDYKDDDYEIAAFTDANGDVDKFLTKSALNIVIVAAFILAVLGCIVSFPKTHKASGATVINVPKSTYMPETKQTQTPENSAVPTETPIPTEKPGTVLIDAGHGGFDPGTQGTITGIFESQINLEISYKLKTLLENRGYVVIMTRTDENALGAGKEEDMVAREEIIKNCDADIFVCIHQNAFTREDVCGPEVYYHETKPSSQPLAQCVEKHICEIPGVAPSRGVKQYGHRLTKFMDYSILIECGFITNAEEEAKLVSSEYQSDMAYAIYEGIEEFFTDYLGK